MRLRTTFLAVLTLLAAMTIINAAQKNDAAKVMFEAAKKKELVDGDLKGAIEQYKAIVAKFKTDRATTADALVHMADCYQKLGDVDARKIYEQVLRDYPEQTAAAATARARLGAVTSASLAAGTTRQLWAPSGIGVCCGAVSSDGRYIAFGDSTGNLAIHDLSTETDRRLTNNANLQTGARETPGLSVFSPDDRRIAFSWTSPLPSQSRSGYALRVLDLNAGNSATPKVLLEANPDFQRMHPFDWSRDGKWIAVQIWRQDRTAQLGLVSASDGSLHILKSINWAGSTHVAFSPDSRYIAFDSPQPDSSDRRDVFVLATDGSREVTAVADPANDLLAGWTADGRHLLFISDRGGTPSLWSVPFEASSTPARPQLINATVGNWANYLGQVRSGALFFVLRVGTWQVSTATMDVDSGKLSEVRQLARATDVSWSPDGKSLAYRTLRADGETTENVIIRSMETDQVRELNPKIRVYGYPAMMWSRDGRSLIVQASDAKGRWGIYRINAQTGDTEMIAPVSHIFTRPGLEQSADGRKVYYAVPNANTYLEVDVASGETRPFIDDLTRGNNSLGIALSRDGRYVSYAAQDPGKKTTAVWVRDLMSGETKELFHVDGLQNLFVEAWTPDSRSVSMLKVTQAASSNPSVELWMLPVNGEKPVRMISGDLSVRAMQVHPDGKHVAVTSVNQSGPQVWTLENFGLPSPNKN